MEQIKKKNRRILVVALCLGVVCSILWRTIFMPKLATPQSINDGLMTYYIISTTLATIPIAIFTSANSWAVAWMLILGFYFSGVAIIPFFGQFGPFDLIFMFIYTLPSILAAFIVKGLNTGIKKIRMKNV